MNPTNQQLAVLLRQARKTLNDTYLQDHTNAYGKWKVECDAAWLAKGVLLPYSSNVTFPSEKEVIAKALELYNSQNPTPAAPLVQPVTVPEPVVELMLVVEEVAKQIAPIDETFSELAETPLQPERQSVEIFPAVETVEDTPSAEEIDSNNDTPIEEAEDVQRTSRLRALLNKFMSTATDLESKNIKGKPNDVQ